jgi:hypothetical protein
VRSNDYTYECQKAGNCVILVNSDESFNVAADVVRGNYPDLLNAIIACVISNTYEFKAERYSIGKCTFSVTPVLESNASNLPCVIRNIERHGMRIYRYNQAVRLLIHDKYDVRTRHIDQKTIENGV